ncbi:MAG: alpha-glucosidase [Desulfobacterales bacterium]|nr:alpha-glucosidase [Desulfobacterales bacterium]
MNKPLFKALAIIFIFLSLFFSCSDKSNKNSNSSPVIKIDSPSDKSVFAEGESIDFLCSVYDNEDGFVTEGSIVWMSNIDGTIGQGSKFTNSKLTPGPHTILTSATDKDGNKSTVQLYIEIEKTKPTWYKDFDGDGYSDGNTITSPSKPNAYYYLASELVASTGDCNDNDLKINPNVSEICGDKIDNNCNSKIDEGCSSTDTETNTSTSTDTDTDIDTSKTEYKTGDFVIKWAGFKKASNIFSIYNSKNPSKILFSSDLNEAFLSVGEADLKVEEKRGSFTAKETINKICKVQTIESITEKGSSVVINGRFTDCNEPYQIIFSQPLENHLSFNVSVNNSRINFISMTYDCGASERFYGFGEQFTYLNGKGHEIPMIAQEGGVGRGHSIITPLVNIASPGSGGTPYSSYYPVPHYITNQNRSLFLENYEYSVFDLKNEKKVIIRLFANSMKGRILYGESMLELITAFTEYSGRMPQPPSWINNGVVIGMQGGTDFVRNVWEKLQKNSTEISAFWLQDWVGKRVTSVGSQLWWNWELDEERYPKWPKLVADFKKEGIKVLGYMNPFLVDASKKGNYKRNLYKEALDNGYLVKDEMGEPVAITNTDFDAGLVDITNPSARIWIKSIIKDQMIAVGLSGWMADFAEALPFDTHLFSGESASSFHNKYPVEWAKLHKEAIKDAGYEGDMFFFNRSGFLESPGYSTFLWEGDQMVTWDGDDGFISGIKGLLSGGFSGISLNHSDAGGYTSISYGGVGYKREKDLLLRWVETNAFTALLRTHEGLQPEANAQFYSDEESLKHFARCSKIYKALSFYRTELFKEASEKGYPVVRHPVLYFPNEGVFLDMDDKTIEFMLGSEFLVAPVIEKNVTKKNVYFPQGKWVSVWDQKIYGDALKGIWTVVDAPLGKPPVFYKQGSSVGANFVKLLKEEEL